MGRVGTLVLALAAACGGGDNMPRNDGGGGGADGAIDGAVDAPPPNTTHRGLVQGAYIASSSFTAISAGFYEEPASAPGCTWTFEGSCFLQVCDTSAGLVARSAGNITVMIGDTPVVLSPDGTSSYPSQNMAIAPGTMATMAAAGETVPAFLSATLTMPQPLDVTAPAHMATIDRAQPLTVTWTPVSGEVYVNLSQAQNGGPYPATYAKTVRCEVDAQAGTVSIPAALLGPLDVGTNNVNANVAANVQDTQRIGDYEVTMRLIALDAIRQLSVQ